MEEIRLFSLCAAMRWNHLPEPGGLYAQHPKLLERFRYIFAKQAEHDEKERKKRENESRHKGGGKRSVAGRRR